MKKLVLPGLVAVAAIVGVGAFVVSALDLVVFLNLPGLLIVVCGTLTATFISRPPHEVMTALRELGNVVRHEEVSSESDMGRILQVADWYRRGNTAAAEREVDRTQDEFLRTGLQLAIGRESKTDLGNALQWRIDAVRQYELANAQVLRTMGSFAPAFGMLGTLLGLLRMLQGIGEAGLADLGQAMAFAMVTTVYGLIASYLLLKPLALKMEQHTARRAQRMHVLREGILLLHERRHPRLIESMLHDLCVDRRDEVSAEAQHAMPQPA